MYHEHTMQYCATAILWLNYSTVYHDYERMLECRMIHYTLLYPQ